MFRRDVKGPNLVIGCGDEETNGIVYMLDFGFARKFRFVFLFSVTR